MSHAWHLQTKYCPTNKTRNSRRYLWVWERVQGRWDVSSVLLPSWTFGKDYSLELKRHKDRSLVRHHVVFRVLHRFLHGFPSCPRIRAFDCSVQIWNQQDQDSSTACCKMPLGKQKFRCLRNSSHATNRHDMNAFIASVLKNEWRCFTPSVSFPWMCLVLTWTATRNKENPLSLNKTLEYRVWKDSLDA